jgi:predicted dehydrogenase
MSIPRLRAVVAGAGQRLMHRHLPQLLDPANQTEVAGIFDPDGAAAARAASLCRAAGQEPAVVTSWTELSTLDADAALIASPNARHFEQAMAFAQRGIHVLVEKPPTITLAQADALAAAAARSGAVVACSFQGALSRERALARDLVRSGGEVRMLRGFVDASWLPAHRGTWRTDHRESGGGFLFDSGSHLLQAALDLGGPVRSVGARLRSDSDVEVDGAALLAFESGATGSLSWCGSVAVPAPRDELEVACEERLVRTGIWGHLVESRTADGPEPIVVSPDPGPWSHFASFIAAGQAPPYASLAMWADVLRLLAAITAASRTEGLVSVRSGAAVPEGAR